MFFVRIGRFFFGLDWFLFRIGLVSFLGLDWFLFGSDFGYFIGLDISKVSPPLIIMKRRNTRFYRKFTIRRITHL